MIRVLLLLFFAFNITNGLPLVEQNQRENGIVGRETLSAYEYYPYMVSIKYTNTSYQENKCGGSIIAKRTILTAAHCITGISYEEVYVISGISNLADDGPRYRAENLITHPEYNLTSTTKDLGLIIVNREIEYTQRVRPIECNKFYEDPVFNAFVVGWGRRASNLPSSNNLKFIYVTKVHESNCGPELQDADSTMCITTHPNEGLCPNDDGGAVVYKNKIFGMVSSIRDPCGDGEPQVVIRISTFYTWINTNMQ